MLQTDRIGRFLTNGQEELLLRRFSGADGVNELFDYRVEAISENPNVDFDKLLGTEARIEIERASGGTRYFHGYITDCAWLGTEGNGTVYALTLRPWFWLLGLTCNQRIFHDKSVVDIVEQVFNAHDFARFETKLSESYDPIHYSVQYGESDLAFVCRMLERHGINYHFRHDAGQHVMVLSDDKSGYNSIGSRKYMPVESHFGEIEDRFVEWGGSRRVTTGKVSLLDYNPLSPKAGMDANESGSASHKNASLEAYGYPGGYLNKGAGGKVAKVRMEQARAADAHHRAKGHVIDLSSGAKFTLTGEHPADVIGKEYVCLRASHSFVNNHYASSGAAMSAGYSGEYELLPTSVRYRPERKTPSSRIEGPQTAVVVGEKGTEIDVDKYGRILVKFHWDKKSDISMRVRCAQMWAHNSYGSMFIPRVGMEVVVVFVDGDPEKPLVVGCVYNGANAPPWELPADKNIAGIKTNSTTGGGGFNQLSFDDTKGKELFYQHAQFDMETMVLNDERRDVGRDRTTNIGRDQKETVGRNETKDIGEEEKRTVGKNRKTSVKMNDTLDVGQVLKMTAKQKIELVCGQSKIVMTPTGIKIESVKIDVKAKAQLKTEALKAEHKATATMTIKGGMVMIN